jgi:hypothetical protein
VFVLDDCPVWLEHPARRKVPKAAAQRIFISSPLTPMSHGGRRALRSSESLVAGARDGRLFFTRAVTVEPPRAQSTDGLRWEAVDASETDETQFEEAARVAPLRREPGEPLGAPARRLGDDRATIRGLVSERIGHRALRALREEFLWGLSGIRGQ